MAKRRKVGNLTALAVLGTVPPRPMHPYEIASVLRVRSKEQDMKIRWGSLYRVVQNLDKYGFLEAVQSERHGGRPERTVYRITDAGRAELVDWVRELVGVPDREELRFKAGLSMLGVLSSDEVVVLLQGRIDALAEQIAAGRAQVPLQATLTDPPDSSAAEATVTKLREVVHAANPDARVGGTTAIAIDTIDAGWADLTLIVPLVIRTAPYDGSSSALPCQQTEHRRGQRNGSLLARGCVSP